MDRLLLVLPTIAGREREGTQNYRAQPEVKDSNMPAQENSHERLLVMISGKTRGGMEGGNLATLEGRHRTGGNALRAAATPRLFRWRT